MFFRRTLPILALGSISLTNCSEYNVGVRSFYNLNTDSYKLAEARIIQLYRDGIFKTNSDSLTKLIARSIPNFRIDIAKNEWTKDGYRKYQLGAVAGQDFVVFYPNTNTYYYYEITNCGGPFGCDVHVSSIIRKNLNTGRRINIPWQDAGASLQEFEDKLLPRITQRLK